MTQMETLKWIQQELKNIEHRLTSDSVLTGP